MPFRSKPLEEIRAQQRELLRRVDPLVGSQEEIQEKLDLVEARLAESNEVLGNLGSLFVEELAPVVAWLEVIGDRLLEVQRAILKPRQTAAQELRDHAFRELRKAKVQTTEADREELINRAYRHLTESAAKLEGDFTVEFTLGVVELYERGDHDRAAKYLRLAAIDAKETSPYDCALSYLFLSFAHLSAGRPVEAETASREATRAAPNDAMVHYLHAEQCAGIGRTQDALASLERACHLEEEHYWRGEAPAPVLFWRALDDGAFAGMRSDVEALCRRLLDEARAEGRRLRAMVKRLVEELVDRLPKEAGSDSLRGSLGRWRARATKSRDQAGYLDVLDANIALWQLGEQLAEESARIAATIRGRYQQAAELAVEFAGWMSVVAGFAVAAVVGGLLGAFQRSIPIQMEVVLLGMASVMPWIFFIAAPFLNRRYKRARCENLEEHRRYWQGIGDAIERWRRDAAKPDRAASPGVAESDEAWSMQPPAAFESKLPWLPVGAAAGIIIATAILVAVSPQRVDDRGMRRTPSQATAPLQAERSKALGAVPREGSPGAEIKPAPGLDLKGDWQGTYIDARGRKVGFSLSIEQRGSSISGRFGERAIVNDVPRDFTGIISGTIEGRKLRFTKTYNEVEGVSVNHFGVFERGDDYVNGVWTNRTTTGRWSMRRDGG